MKLKQKLAYALIMQVRSNTKLIFPFLPLTFIIIKFSFLVLAPPSPPTPSGFHAISFTSAVLLWVPPHDTPLCAHNYTVHISRVNSGDERRTHSNGTFITISELFQGVEYAFIVQATDRAGRTGSSSLPMYFVLDGN